MQPDTNSLKEHWLLLWCPAADIMLVSICVEVHSIFHKINKGNEVETDHNSNRMKSKRITSRKLKSQLQFTIKII